MHDASLVQFLEEQWCTIAALFCNAEISKPSYIYDEQQHCLILSISLLIVYISLHQIAYKLMISLIEWRYSITANWPPQLLIP